MLVEHFAGHLPLWLAPVQCELVPVQDDDDSVLAYIDSVAQRLRDAGVRTGINVRVGERMQAKVRDAELRRVPYVVVIGKRDVEQAAAGAGTLMLRDVRRHEQRGVMLETLAGELRREVEERRPR